MPEQCHKAKNGNNIAMKFAPIVLNGDKQQADNCVGKIMIAERISYVFMKNFRYG